MHTKSHTVSKLHLHTDVFEMILYCAIELSNPSLSVPMKHRRFVCNDVSTVLFRFHDAILRNEIMRFGMEILTALDAYKERHGEPR